VKELERVSIPQHAVRLTEPFTMIDLVQLDDLVLSLFLCQGTLPHHRHLDQDELFLVYTGTISLESDWGTVILRPGELAVAPKGVGHRSSSLLRSLVLLLQPRLLVNRRNGHRRLFSPKGEKRLDKVAVPAVGRHVGIPFQPVVLANLDTYAVHLILCHGTGPWWQARRQSELVLCFSGPLSLETEEGQLLLESWELVRIPQGMAYRLGGDRALAISLERHRQPGLPLVDA
jgi:mannose-6-phosphate isomerase-like protein (cupin superfamily)